MEIASAFQRRGLLFVLSSPSGAGKSTIARMLLAADDGVAMSISATTRPIRPGEVDGRDYHFVTEHRFDEMVADGAFLEWAHVFGHRYGTLKSEVLKVIEALAAAGMTMIMVTHEMRFAHRIADKVIFMHEGRVKEEGTADILSNPDTDELKQFIGNEM